MAARWMKKIAVMTYPAIIREQENVTSNRAGYWYMNFGTMCLFSYSIVLVRIQNYSKNDLDKLEFEAECRVLEYHKTTEEEKYDICEWKYEGEYVIYNNVPYEEQVVKNCGFANQRNNFYSL